MLPALCTSHLQVSAAGYGKQPTARCSNHTSSQAYIDNLKATGQVENAVISDLATGEAWTGGLAVTADEAWAISTSSPQTAALYLSPNTPPNRPPKPSCSSCCCPTRDACGGGRGHRSRRIGVSFWCQFQKAGAVEAVPRNFRSSCGLLSSARRAGEREKGRRLGERSGEVWRGRAGMGDKRSPSQHSGRLVFRSRRAGSEPSLTVSPPPFLCS